MTSSTDAAFEPSPEARAVFSTFLQEHPDAPRERFRELCAEHRDVAFELQCLYADLAPEPSFSALLRRLAERARAPRIQDERALLRRLLDWLEERRSDRYETREELAEGGMGSVHKVWDRDLDRTLAMKTALGSARLPLGAHELDGRTLARFLEEARVTAKLDHPGIVPVHDVGLDANGRVYFTMQLVRGQSLEQVIRRVENGGDGWTRARVLGVILKACEAVAYAHSKGVIHRDLKPANIMVGRFGEVYVMDWGLAKLVGEESVHDVHLLHASSDSFSRVRSLREKLGEDEGDSPLVTLSGEILGTPVYMPPEQAEGRIGEMGTRSDVYSMGALLYRLLSERKPYVEPGERVSPLTVLERVLDGPPRRVRELNPAVPPELAAICERAMARAPDERYADTLRMAEDLRSFLEERAEGAPERRLPAWRALAFAAAGAVALLVVQWLAGA